MRDTVAAFVSAVEAQGVTVFEGDAGNLPAAPYCVVYAPRPRPGDKSEAATHKSMRWRIATLYVGTSHQSVLWMAEKVATALQDQRLSITGLNCSKLTAESGTPARVDPDNDSVFSATDAWVFTTTPQ